MSAGSILIGAAIGWLAWQWLMLLFALLVWAFDSIFFEPGRKRAFAKALAANQYVPLPPPSFPTAPIPPVYKPSPRSKSKARSS